MRLHSRLPLTLHLQYIFWYCLEFTHAIIMNTYEKAGLRTHMRFTSMNYTNIEWVSPSFRHKMSGRDLLRSDGQAGLKLALDLFCRTFVFLASGSRKHRTLSLELELSRAFVNSVGKNARNRDGGTWNGHMTRWSDVSPSTTPTSLSAAFTRQELARSLVSDNGWGNAW